MFKRFLASCLILALLALPAAPAAYAVSLRVGGTTVSGSLLYRGVTYVPLRPAARLLCPGAAVSWSDGQAVVKTSALTLTARPGECWIGANGRMNFSALLSEYAVSGLPAWLGYVISAILGVAILTIVFKIIGSFKKDKLEQAK